MPLTRYLVGASGARLAAEGVAIALVLLVRATGEGASWQGLFVAAWAGPSLLSGFVVGHGLDRSFHPGRFLAAAGVVAAAALGLDAALIGRVACEPLLAMTALGGLTVPLFTGGTSSLLPDLVASDRLGSAQGLDSATYSVAGIAGPALVALIAAASPRLGLIVPAAAVAVGAGVVPVARSASSTTAPTARLSLPTTVRALASTRQLLATTTASTVAAFGWGGLEIGAAAVAAGLGSAHLAGIDLATIAFAALAVSLGRARRPSRRPERAIVAALITMAAGAAVVAVAPTAVIALAGCAVFGIGDGGLLPAVLAVRSRDAPAGLTAAVFTTAASIKTAATAVGAAIAGTALGALGAGGLLLALAATQLLAAAISVVAISDAPRTDDDPPASGARS